LTTAETGNRSGFGKMMGLGGGGGAIKIQQKTGLCSEIVLKALRLAVLSL